MLDLSPEDTLDYLEYLSEAEGCFTYLICCILADLWADKIGMGRYTGQGRRFAFLRNLLSGKDRQCSQESLGKEHENVPGSTKENCGLLL